MARRLPTMVVPKAADIPPGNITAPEWTQAKNQAEAAYTEVSVLAALRFDPEHPNYGAVRGSRSVEPDALTKAANRAAIQLAADDAHSAGGTLVIKGAYWIDDTIEIRCHVDGASGELLVSDTSISPAVLVGHYQTGDMLHNKHIVLPGIRQMGKTGTGWSGNDTGLIIGNTYSCHITVTGIHNFSNGMRATSYSNGNVYNNVYLGIFENNKVGLDITTENAGGWTNEAVWIGGRFHINSGEGTNIPGARHIRIQDTLYSNNNHLFLSPSIEGNGPEHHVELGGNNNTIIQGRWEATPPKVLWGANANSNVIYQGWGAYQIQATGSGLNCRITSRQSDRWFAGGGSSGLMRLMNQSSTNSPVISIMPATGAPWSMDPATQYGMQLGARYTRWKRSTDDHDRITVDAEQGRILFGQGDVAPTNYIGTAAGSTVVGDDSGTIFYWDRPTVNDQTSAVLLMRTGGATALRRVKVGAENSGGSGLRALVVDN